MHKRQNEQTALVGHVQNTVRRHGHGGNRRELRVGRDHEVPGRRFGRLDALAVLGRGQVVEALPGRTVAPGLRLSTGKVQNETGGRDQPNGVHASRVRLGDVQVALRRERKAED